MKSDDYKMAQQHQYRESQHRERAIDYVSGLMSLDEERIFEGQLVEDIAIQDAVIWATEAVVLAKTASIQTLSEQVSFQPADSHLPNVQRLTVTAQARGSVLAQRKNQKNTIQKLSIACSILASCFLLIAMNRMSIDSRVSERLSSKHTGHEAAWIIDEWATSESVVLMDDFDSMNPTDNGLDVPDWLVSAVSAESNNEQPAL